MSARGAKCASCEKRLRAGSIKWAFLLSDAGVVRALVCTACFRGSMPLLIPKPVSIAPLCSECRRESASVCRGCVAKLERSVRELVAANVALRQLRAVEDGKDAGVELCRMTEHCEEPHGHDGPCTGEG
jgi:hypothetical protein